MKRLFLLGAERLWQNCHKLMVLDPPQISGLVLIFLVVFFSIISSDDITCHFGGFL